MSLVDLPDELIIQILQFVEPAEEYGCLVGLKRNENSPTELYAVYDLVCSAKRFKFLTEKSYLVHTSIDAGFGDTFTSVDYFGYRNGPEFWLICGNWEGYVDDEIEIYPRIHIGCFIINGKSYDGNNFDFDGLIDEIYKNFKDVEMKKHIEKYSGIWQFHGFMIRDRFPSIKLPLPRNPEERLSLEQIAEKYRVTRTNNYV